MYRYQLNPQEEAGIQVDYADGIKGVEFVKMDDLRAQIQADPNAYTKSLRESFLQDNLYRQISDKAMFNQSPANGGIDLNQINVNRSGKIINIQFDPSQLTEIIQGGFEGFTPVIINVTPIQNPMSLMGGSTAQNEEALTAV
jgi:hypothetical protein